MFRVKICGITNVEDANVAVEAGAEAIGLNFYAKSPRCVSVEVAREISNRVGASAKCVAVVVNKPAADVLEIAGRTRLLCVQLHGDEPASSVAAIPDALDVIRARRMDSDGVAAIAADIEACRRAGRGPSALLIDAMTPGCYGGTGKTVSWVGLADHDRWLRGTPLILAGGLTPDNVAKAIRIVRPAAVDVASGVESAPGKKDPAKVRDFVANAMGAFASLRAT
ncbi:MAG TPA: phosphoribosylanthranilate isomerase [Lacipirellulaceae bacterium]|nr:phosphoribosylanthranilate isomerase [Lacipirellulaceae bacterium]